MEEKPPTQGRDVPRSRTPRAAFSTPDQPTPPNKPAERTTRRPAKAAPPVTFQPPSSEGSAEPPSRPPRKPISGTGTNSPTADPAPEQSAQPTSPAPEPAPPSKAAAKSSPAKPTSAAPEPAKPPSPSKATAKSTPAKAQRAKPAPAQSRPAKPAADSSEQPTPAEATPTKAVPTKAAPAQAAPTKSVARPPKTTPPEPAKAAKKVSRRSARPIPAESTPPDPAATRKAATGPRTTETARPAADAELMRADYVEAASPRESRATIPAQSEPTRTTSTPEPKDDVPATDVAPQRTDAWAKLIADPGHAPELLALAAVQTIGPRADLWGQRIREQYPTATEDAVARLALRQFTRFGGLSSIFGAVAGSYAPIALLGAAALTHAELILHVAAAYRVDPADEARAVDLLVLTRVHPSREDAAAALATARHPAYEEDTKLTDAVWRFGRMAAAQAGGWGAIRVVNRFFPGVSLLAATLTSRASAQTVGARAAAYYRAASA